MFRYLHLDGRYTYTAAAVYAPGDVVVRPDGSLAIFDGIQSCAIGQAISPDPLSRKPTAIVTKKSTDVCALADLMYWDATNLYATKTSSGNKLIGTIIEAAGSGVLECHINTGGKEVAV